MIPADFTAPLANHLWQSTLIAALAGLLAFALRKNHARTRHWLWLAASIKFLIPFSVLAALGSQLGSLTGWPAAQGLGQPDVSFVVEQISRPFAATQGITAVAPATAAHSGKLLPAILFAVWMIGFGAVACAWLRQWLRVRCAVREASPLAPAAGLPILSSPLRVEPGVVGIFRPVLLLPEGITDHLTPAHLQAIVAHEQCHVRRRDNLAAAVHMAVEAIFWFHPLVWWMGARLVEERERACDEEVLRLGNRPEVYAESILKTCQFYLESPLACMSGIAGSDLKKRVVRIMTQQFTHQLSFGRKLLLAAAGIAAVVGPVVFGLVNAPASHAQSPAAASSHPTFDVVSIKPSPNHDEDRVLIRINPGGGFTGENITIRFLLEQAYNIKGAQLSGAPGWIDTERYNVEAKVADDSSPDQKPRLSREEQQAQFRLMLQAMLADRFKLTMRHETKELPIYALVVAKNGPKFHETTIPADDSAPGAPPPPPPPPGAPAPPAPPGAPGVPPLPPVRGRIMMMDRGQLNADGITIERFADVLSRQIGRLVVDKTGLKGSYDLTLNWAPEEGQGQMFRGAGESRDAAPPPSNAAGPSIFTALQEQLGLKIENQKGPVDTLVIEHIDRPTEN